MHPGRPEAQHRSLWMRPTPRPMRSFEASTDKRPANLALKSLPETRSSSPAGSFPHNPSIVVTSRGQRRAEPPEVKVAALIKQLEIYARTCGDANSDVTTLRASNAVNYNLDFSLLC